MAKYKQPKFRRRNVIREQARKISRYGNRAAKASRSSRRFGRR